MSVTPTRWPGLPDAVLEILPEPVFVKDEALQFVWANAAFEDLFDLCRHNIIGRSAAEVFPGRPLTECDAGDIRVMETGKPEEVEERFLTRGQPPRVFLIRKSRLQLANRFVLVGMMLDVTRATRTIREMPSPPRHDAA